MIQRVPLNCDTAQAFPRIVCLIPALMLFGTLEIMVICSPLIFAMVLLIRQTIEGLRMVPEERYEAVDMAGAMRLQKLWNVQPPWALSKP
ncbi:MAG: hypothetical protein R8G34_01490 [Paracoccaceae bacterium]|nr:hypothetical protein [Paracoccaceae bacterium]